MNGQQSRPGKMKGLFLWGLALIGKENKCGHKIEEMFKCLNANVRELLEKEIKAAGKTDYNTGRWQS